MAKSVDIGLSDFLGKTPGLTQLEFVLAGDREVCWVGGFGCGKTFGLAAKAALHMVKYPGSKSMLCRLTYDEMISTTKQTFFIVAQKLYDLGLVERPRNWDYKESTNFVRLVNGSELSFKNLEDPTRRYKNFELTFVGIDQAEENEFEVFEILNNRLRRTANTKHIPENARQIVLIANDGGFNWLYERYHPEANTDPIRRRFFHATSLDNPHLDQEYLRDLLNNSPEWVDRNVFAKMRKDQGRLLLDPKIIDTFSPPPGANVYLGVDHGESSVCSAHFAWVNDTGSQYGIVPPWWTVIFREYWKEGEAVDTHAREIRLKCEDINVISKVMDHTAFRLTQTKKGGFRRSVADVYADCDLFLVPSVGDPEARIERYNSVASRGLIVTRDCPNLIRQIPKYHNKMNMRTGKPEIVKRSTFHAIDSVGYTLMSIPRPGNPINQQGPDPLSDVPAHLQPGHPYWKQVRDDASRNFALANWQEREMESTETVPFTYNEDGDSIDAPGV